jgi:hypothetical protein
MILLRGTSMVKMQNLAGRGSVWLRMVEMYEYEIPRPAGESAGLRDDADRGAGRTRTLPLQSKQRSRGVRTLRTKGEGA